MPDLSYILGAMSANRIGLAPHYLFIYAAVLGLEAKAVFEFGAGMSTRVILDALCREHKWEGHLISCSTESEASVRSKWPERYRNEFSAWAHWQMMSTEAMRLLNEEWSTAPVFDLVLHDGSHAGDVVEADLRAILPRVRRYGLVLVHDVQHSYVGAQMRKAVSAIIRDFDVSHVTLPYGFGLTILRQEAPWHPPITITRNKVGSPHRTMPCRVEAN